MSPFWLGTLIIVISLVLFLIVLAISYFRKPELESPFTCPTGECPISLATGQKDCSRQTYDPKSEGCSLALSCSNPALPYTVQPDNGGSQAPCALGQPCRCQPFSACPSYITSQFLSNGQLTSLQVNKEESQGGVCSIAVTLLFGAGGGCTATSAWTTSASRERDIISCLASNPCQAGQLAYLADPSTFTADRLTLEPVACVAGTTGYDSFGRAITAGAVPIWDVGWGGVVQKTI